MQVISNSMSAHVPELMRQMAIFFIQFRPASGRTLYCHLTTALADLGLLDRVIFSTLNYECILEFSLLMKSIPFNYFDPIDKNPHLPVWKLHGSCNMFATGVSATPGVVYTAGVIFQGGLEALMDSNDVIGRWLCGTALAPAMCLYMKGKPLSISPDLIHKIQNMWQDAVAESDILFCVGVNPNVEDAHIWKPIAETSSRLLYIGAQQAFEAWLQQYRHGPAEFLGDRFSTSFGILRRSLAEYAAK